MGDKNPKKRPKQKKAGEKINMNLHSMTGEEEQHHGKQKKTY